MKLLLLVMVATAGAVTSLHAGPRVRCDCRLSQVNYRQIGITCANNGAQGTPHKQRPDGQRMNIASVPNTDNVAGKANQRLQLLAENVEDTENPLKRHSTLCLPIHSWNIVAWCGVLTDIKGHVPRGYEYVEGSGFYKLFRTSLTYEKALARCWQDGAYLAVPSSAHQARAIGAILGSNPAVTEAFVGINDLTKTGTFKSVHGTPLDLLGYHEWSRGQPDNKGPYGEQCVTINAEGLYSDNRCDRVFAFVCQRPLPYVLPAGYRYFPQLGFYKHYTTPETYEGAKQRCLRDGGHLAVLDTQEEADEVIKFYDVTNVTESYVGLNDIQTEGVFVSETGKLLTSLSFANWYPGEPKNGGPGGEHCATLHVDGNYNDVACARRYPFFCEIPLPSS